MSYTYNIISNKLFITIEICLRQLWLCYRAKQAHKSETQNEKLRFKEV